MVALLVTLTKSRENLYLWSKPLTSRHSLYLQKTEGFIVFFSIVKQRNCCFPQFHIWILQILDFLGGPIKGANKKRKKILILA